MSYWNKAITSLAASILISVCSLTCSCSATSCEVVLDEFNVFTSCSSSNNEPWAVWSSLKHNGTLTTLKHHWVKKNDYKIALVLLGWLRLMIIFVTCFQQECVIFSLGFLKRTLWKEVKCIKGSQGSKQMNTAKSKNSPAFLICLEPLAISHWYHDWIAPKSQLLRNRGLHPTSDKIRREICDTVYQKRSL